MNPTEYCPETYFLFCLVDKTMASASAFARFVSKDWIQSFMGVGLLMMVATTGTAASLFFTDLNWKVTPTAPGAGWESNAAFDASSWQSATELYNVSDFLGPTYSAKGIWSSGGQFSATETTVWARGIWNLPTLPTSASLEVGFDDDGDLYINGTQVVSDHNGTAGNTTVADILPYLHTGDNLIAFTASDNIAFGINHSAWAQINGEAAAATPTAIPTLSEWGMIILSSLLALGTLFTLRRKCQ